MNTTLPAAAPNTTAQNTALRATRLIERFEDQITAGFHSIARRYNNSNAGTALREAGPFILGEIALHLEETQDREGYGGYNSAADLRQAWILLLKDIARTHNLHHMPENAASISDWISWARRNAMRQAA